MTYDDVVGQFRKATTKNELMAAGSRLKWEIEKIKKKDAGNYTSIRNAFSYYLRRL